MSRNQSPIVPRTFSEQLSTLVQRAAAAGWGKKYSIDFATLEADSKAQEKEKQAHTLEKQTYTLKKQAFQQHDQKFKAEQGARYGRYVAALDVLRAVFKRQPEVLASLADFKRPGAVRRKKAAPATPATPRA